MIGATSPMTGAVHIPNCAPPTPAHSRNAPRIEPESKDTRRDENHDHDRRSPNHWQHYAREQRLRSELRRTFVNAVPAAQAYDNVYAQMRQLVDERDAAAYAVQTSQLVDVAQRIDALDALDAAIETKRGDEKNVAPLETRTALTAALVGQDVYFDRSIPQILPKRVQRFETNDDNGPEQSGFFGALYSDNDADEIFVANRGTEMGIAGRSEVDWQQNVRQALGLRASQYDRGIAWADTLAQRYGSSRLIFTGHSLGGGLASAEAAAVPSARALTFDPAGVHVSTMARHDAALNDTGVTAYHVQGEVLSVVRTWVWAAARWVSDLPIIGGFIKPWVAASIPHRLGRSIALPPSPPPSAIKTGATSADWQPPSGIRGAIERHGMHQMIYALFAGLGRKSD